MTPKDFPAFYFSGIAVVAVKYGIQVQQLSIGDDQGLNGEAVLEPIEEWCDLSVGYDSFKAMQIEDYVTTLLAGSAASFVREQSLRSHITRSFGDAGLEMKYLREVWGCLQREPDRAVAIVCGSLGKFDDGDIEATTKRLWHRAVRVLQQSPQSEQLTRLARLLMNSGQLAGHQIRHLLSSKR